MLFSLLPREVQPVPVIKSLLSFPTGSASGFRAVKTSFAGEKLDIESIFGQSPSALLPEELRPRYDEDVEAFFVPGVPRLASEVELAFGARAPFPVSKVKRLQVAACEVQAPAQVLLECMGGNKTKREAECILPFGGKVQRHEVERSVTGVSSFPRACWIAWHYASLALSPGAPTPSSNIYRKLRLTGADPHGSRFWTLRGVRCCWMYIDPPDRHPARRGEDALADGPGEVRGSHGGSDHHC